MARKVGTTRGAKERADHYFSKIVRSVGYCAACGKTEHLQCAHIISRRYSHTRCDFENALCLCAGCHHHFTDHPVEWGQFVLQRMSEDDYRVLVKRSQQTSTVVWIDVVQKMKLRMSELELV